MRMFRFSFVIPVIAALFSGQAANAQQQYNALAECRAQSLELDLIHACMDGYLDSLDDNMQVITRYLGESLSGEALAGLESSQQAYLEYRRRNCLWYLDFSSPRDSAEQIAKNCLADMSVARLQELQKLLTGQPRASRTIEGFYVYGAQRNSFQPCGRTERYWVESENGTVGLLQQSYLALASDELQLMHAVLVGKISDELQPPDDYHTGVMEIEALVELGLPAESDCTLPEQPASLELSSNDGGALELAEDLLTDEAVESEEPEQRLTAYFGSWLVDCVEFSGRKSCVLQVPLSEDGVEQQELVDGERYPALMIHRTPANGTYIEVEFPDREIDSPMLVRWNIDQIVLGDIVGSEVRVDESGALVLINEGEFLKSELIPKLTEGREVSFSVRKRLDDASGDMFRGSLQGLTKALSFADSFVEESELSALQ